MTLPQNVKDAVGNVDACRLETFDADWQTIRAHLLSQDAEIERLNAECKQHLRQAMENGWAANAADALLGKVYAYLDRFDPNSEVYDEVETHLQGAGYEA